jgi:nucleotide-binding universal stress UspA family protein
MKVKRILIPVDFSSHSLAALDYAAELAKPFKAALLVVHVVEPILYYTAPDFAGAAAAASAELIDEQRRSVRARLVRLEQRYAKRRLKLRALLQTGAPYQAIADTARQEKADLIVMATHGHTGLSHLLMGSVAERVVRSAACPVLTLHPQARARRRTAGKRAPARARRRQ